MSWFFCCKTTDNTILVKFHSFFTLDPIGRDSVWFLFFKKVSFGQYRSDMLWKMLSLISTICGVFTRAHLAASGRYTAVRISHAFCRWASFPVLWKTVVFSMCYHGFLYLLKCKLLFRSAIVVLLGCCEFKPNVTSVRIHVCSRIAMPHTAGAWWVASGSAKWGYSGCFGWLEKKNDGDILTR